MNMPLVLLGGGGHAAVVADSAVACGFSIAGYLDDRPVEPAPVADLKWLGRVNDLQAIAAKLGPCMVHAAVGDGDLRRTWLDAADDLPIATIAHPSASVSLTARVEVGAFIGPGAIINARASIGRGVIVNSGAIIEHDCVLGLFAHVAPGAVLAGAVEVGEAGLVGANATVLPGVRLGARSVLGAGAVATQDVPEGVTCVGIPARILQRT